MAKFRKKPVIIEAVQIDEEMTVETLEGVMKGNPQDWLITGVQGEQYFCKPDIFELTYQSAEGVFQSPFTREELFEIVERSLYLSFPIETSITQTWGDAYRQLAFASDRLDAMIARTELEQGNTDDA